MTRSAGVECFSCSRLRAPSLRFQRSSCCPAQPGASRWDTSRRFAAYPVLYLRYAPLRLAAGRGTLWFFAFCAVWAGLGVALSQPPFSYSSERIGMYAFAGLLGIVATRIAGAWTDRVGARKVLLVGLVVALTAAVILAACLSNTAVTLACLGLFDAGLFAAQVANQSTVLAIDPAAPAQFNSAYMLDLLRRRQPRHRVRCGRRRVVRMAHNHRYCRRRHCARHVHHRHRSRQHPVTRLRPCPIQY